MTEKDLKNTVVLLLCSLLLSFVVMIIQLNDLAKYNTYKENVETVLDIVYQEQNDWYIDVLVELEEYQEYVESRDKIE